MKSKMSTCIYLASFKIPMVGMFAHQVVGTGHSSGYVSLAGHMRKWAHGIWQADSDGGQECPAYTVTEQTCYK